MNSHKNARLTFEGRRLLIERIAVMGLMPAAQAAGISLRTARKWRRRFEAAGVDALMDTSSRPARTRNTIDESLGQRIEQLRRNRMPMRHIAAVVGRSVATISRWLAKLGLSSLKALQPAVPVVRYEHETPGAMLHMDTKKLGRIERPSHRVTGNRRDSVDGAGWEFAHVAIDDHSRVGFVQMHADERKGSAVDFLQAAVAHYAALGVRIERLLTDNGAAYRSRLFAKTRQALGIKHCFTKPYHPQTNGKAERFIQTCLREWAYGRTWQHSSERTAWLPSFLTYYNTRRPHSALGHHPPASRLGGNNLLQLNRQTRIERGFVGAHADIGGGFGPGADSVLARVALAWMVQQARDAGINMQALPVNTIPASPVLHDKSDNQYCLNGPGCEEDRQVRYRGGATTTQRNMPVPAGMSHAETARFIRYLPPGINADGSVTREPQGDFVTGTVDARGYLQWLRNNGYNLGNLQVQ